MKLACFAKMPRMKLGRKPIPVVFILLPKLSPIPQNQHIVTTSVSKNDNSKVNVIKTT